MNFLDQKELKQEILSQTVGSTPCINCQRQRLKISVKKEKDAQRKIHYQVLVGQKKLSSLQLRDLLNRTTTFPLDKLLLKGLYGHVADGYRESFSPDVFIFQNLPIPSNNTRPLMRSLDKRSSKTSVWNLHDSSKEIADIIRADEEYQLRSTTPQMASTLFDRLQLAVHNHYSSENSSFQHRIDKKTGIMRARIQGKRVNHTARSVVNPDPFLATNQVMFSQDFAKKIAFPTVVNDLNFQQMKELVINGPDTYPGALWVRKGGTTISLELEEEQRRQIAASLRPATSGTDQPMVVGRHAKNGDFCIVNRQPTLHKYGLLGLKLRGVRKGGTTIS